MATFSVTTFLVALQLIAPLTMVLTESVRMPAECVNRNFCLQKGKDYPEYEIRKLYERNQLPQMLMEAGGTKDLGPRQGGPGDLSRRMCPSKHSNTNVYYIVDESNKTRVVVQLPEVFKQVFRLEQCLHSGTVKRPAGHVTKNDITNRDMYCENVYYNYEFYVLSDNKSRLERAYSKGGVPVFCACKYRNSEFTKNGDISRWNIPA